MSDELDDLKAALDAAAPRPDPAVKAAHLRLAQENFTRSQESVKGPRPNSEDRPAVGWLQTGVNAVIRTLSPLKATLVATTAIVAVGVVLVIPETRQMLTPSGQLSGGITEADDRVPAEKPVPADTLGRDEGKAKTAADADSALRQREQDAELRADTTVTDQPAPEPLVMAEEAPMAPPSTSAPKRSVAGALADSATGGPVGGRVGGIVAPSPMPEMKPAPEENTEAFANKDPNPVKITTEEPVSTFSIDVDTASYAVVRSSLMGGYLPDPQAVRVEEMVNYFPYAYPAPDGAQPFQPTVTVMGTPWNKDTRLVHIALQGKLPAMDDRPPLNLVFLIDTSGSMEDANKLPLLKQSFRMMLNELRPEDQVAIVTYAGSAGQVLAPTKAGEKSTILSALDRLSAGGSTAGQAGLEQAYSVAEGMSGDGEVTRVILATDGDFNVGISDPGALKSYIEAKRKSGTYLSVLGFGRGNLDDATMQSLAQNGNGTAAYIDTLNEARKVLVDELSGALFPIADDVKIQVEWNPAAVAEYRLIGYETRALKREDFNNDKVDAGEIGAGTAVTAIYEVTPVGSAAVLNDPLRYGTGAAPDGAASELGFLRLRYKAPGETASQLIETPIPVAATEGGTEARFAAAVAGFGQLLRGSDYLGDWGYADAVALATGAKGEDDFGYRAEAIQLMRLAEGLAGN